MKDKVKVRLLASCGDKRAQGERGQIVETDREFAEFLISHRAAEAADKNSATIKKPEPIVPIPGEEDSAAEKLVSSLPLAKPIVDSLGKAGVATVEQLVALVNSESLSETNGIGPASAEAIIKVLTEQKLITPPAPPQE